MATAGRLTPATADDRAWDLFFDSLDADSAAALRVPPGAAIVAADAPDRTELVRRYHADRRTVVVVHEDGRGEILSPRSIDRVLLVGGLALLVGWLVAASGRRLAA